MDEYLTNIPILSGVYSFSSKKCSRINILLFSSKKPLHRPFPLRKWGDSSPWGGVTRVVGRQDTGKELYR